ncbi:MAG: hypothetical protein AB4911_07525 [Oscillochloridaceae bacterium umkhey_bin13]
MRFPLADHLNLPCVFERLLPGRLHPDGRRYLPVIVLRPTSSAALFPTSLRLAVVDRHHRVREADQGRPGQAKLVFALGELHAQSLPYQKGLVPEAGWQTSLSETPTALGQVQAISAWEEGRGTLPYQTLYAELTLDLGLGIVGVRTNLTAPDLALALGAPRLTVGMHASLERARIDILGFEPL